MLKCGPLPVRDFNQCEALVLPQVTALKRDTEKETHRDTQRETHRERHTERRTEGAQVSTCWRIALKKCTHTETRLSYLHERFPARDLARVEKVRRPST